MPSKCFFFAGGGTGGHIYPAVALAEQILKLEPQSKIHFFVSSREIDTQILAKTRFTYTQLPAKGFSIRPGKLIEFCTSLFESYRIANEKIDQGKNAVVIGTGGFVAAPVCWAAHKLKMPVALVNADIVAGRANRLIARWADEIFTQFEETTAHFAQSRARISNLGCPLRKEFSNPQPDKAIQQLGLDGNKRILLITGASSGSESINEAVCSLLEKLSVFADEWQIVHLTGQADFEKVKSKYAGAELSHKVLRYCDDMANLLSAADLVVGRSGAVSVAEYAATSAPSICVPYPHHKDKQQYLNASKLVEAGAAVIVDDLPDAEDRAQWLWEELQELMKDPNKRRQMKEACSGVAKKDTASKIAEKLLKMVVAE